MFDCLYIASLFAFINISRFRYQTIARISLNSDIILYLYIQMTNCHEYIFKINEYDDEEVYSILRVLFYKILSIINSPIVPILFCHCSWEILMKKIRNKPCYKQENKLILWFSADVDCGSPEIAENGKVVLPSNATYYGALALYACQQNFELDGVSRRLCLENGTWSSDAPKCRGNNARNILISTHETSFILIRDISFNLNKITIEISSNF